MADKQLWLCVDKGAGAFSGEVAGPEIKERTILPQCVSSNESLGLLKASRLISTGFSEEGSSDLLQEKTLN